VKLPLLLASSLFMVVLSTSGYGQVTIDITKLTCRQFLLGRQVPTNSIALWFSGYYSGKRGITTIDAGTIRPNAEKVKDYCGPHQDETVMHAVETLFGAK
jgi:acid stress chaperone HdeB